jgi:superfamily II DNA or RNA helicase
MHVQLARGTVTQVVVRMLDARFGPLALTDDARLHCPQQPPAAPHPRRPATAPGTASPLTPFQSEAVDRIQRMLRTRAGAFLSDSVGLGKSHIGAAIIAEWLECGEPVVVCAPASLRTHWHRLLRRLRGWSWISHTSLSRAPLPFRLPFAGLLVVDEAHALRNPATRRYRNAAMLTEHAAVLLITATPVNNSIFDFYHLVRLFAADDAFAELGVPNLRDAVEAAAGGGNRSPVRRVAEAVMVRRTRTWIEREFGRAALTAEGVALRFPRREPVRRIIYDFAAAWPGFARSPGPDIARLRFPAHSVHGSPAPAELMRLGLLKRLESSNAAFAAAVAAHVALLEQFRDAARAGYLLGAGDRRLLARADDQLPLHGVLLRPWPPQLEPDPWIDHADADLRLLRPLRDRALSAPDSKVQRLRELLHGEFRRESVLIFTEFRSTAVSIWRALSPAGGVALIHGGEARLGGARAGRRTVIERFAPLAAGRTPAAAHERVRVLIATDVLAEGLNLQDARVVISYDLPWNPVRLAQRIGRIDRLGSPHDAIAACAFVPADGLEQLLGLVRRVRRKLRDIHIVGGDAPALQPAPDRPRTLRHGRDATRHLLADDDWDVVAALRSAQRRCTVAADGAANAASCPFAADPAANEASCLLAADRAVDQGCLVAPFPWEAPARGAICCIPAPGGAGALLALVREDRREVLLNDRTADNLLLRALSPEATSGPPGTAAGRPAPVLTDADLSWLRTATRRALHAVRRELEVTASVGIRPRAAGPAPAEARAAAAVRRWLRERPGGPTDAECATADRVLSALAAVRSTAAALRLAAALRTAETPAEIVRVLSTLPDGVQNPRVTRPRERPTLRVTAVLVLVPDE